MAEEEESTKSKFKSKWGRLFKEKEEHEGTPKHTNSFKLDDDVTAFLKPSTDKAASTRPPNFAPKIDVAIAQRWPDPNDVRRLNSGTASAQAFTPNGFRKPKRRKGLTVGFVKTVPEMIGEGGDECMDVVAEISRQKAMVARSVSDRRPSAVPDTAQWPQSPPPSATRPANQIRASNGVENDFRAGPLRRAHTSHNESSPPVQKRQMAPTIQERAPPLRNLSRTPTGLGSQDDELEHSDDEEHPQMNDRFAGLGPRDPNSLARKRLEYGSGEGMMLRRASAMIIGTDGTEDEDEKRESLSMGLQPHEQLYETLSREDAPSIMPEVPEPRSALSPRWAASSKTSPSPFDDPKYVNRHPHENTTTSSQAPQSFRQQRPACQPRYMRNVQPAPSETTPNNPTTAQDTSSQVQQSARSREVEPIARRNDELSNVQPAQPPANTFANRPPPAPAEDTIAPEKLSGSQSTSQVPFRPANNNIATLPKRPSNPTTSAPATSPNDSRLPPGYAHSRSTSRDGALPHQTWSNGSDPQKPSSASTFQPQSSSPQSHSPQSSTLTQPGISPYGRVPSPNPTDYFVASKAGYAQQARSPAGGVRQEDAGRPGSSGSSRSFQRPTINFSAPRMPQSQAPATNVQQPDTARRPSACTTYLDPRQRNDSSTQRAASQTRIGNVVSNNLRSDDVQRPGSAGSYQAPQRPIISPQPTSEGNPAADAAYADFAARVAHMKGVFRLTAEKEQPSDRVQPLQWLRTALWWYLRGKAGLEALLQHRPRSSDGQPRQLLAQPHVDLAKTWWILSDPLEFDDDASSPSDTSSLTLEQSITSLRSHLKALALSMGRNKLMPPHQSLIQGQDTSIWLQYPSFSSNAAVVLANHGTAGQSSGNPPLEALPLGDTHETFCYGRFPVDVSINTDDAHTDRVLLPCTLSMLRGRRDFSNSVVIASQSELVTLNIGPRRSDRGGLTWQDVAWKGSAFGVVVRLPRGFDMTVRMQERDFRSLWNLVEYASKVEHSLRAERDESLAYEARLAELQYSDSSNSNTFPTEKLRNASALVFEQTAPVNHAGGQRKMHRGYRLVLVTGSNHKSLASSSFEVCKSTPLYYEYITDSAAHGMAAMVIRIREETRQCRILLVFPDAGARQHFYDVLNGLTVGPDEMILGKANLASMNIEPATQIEGFTHFGHPALRMLQWQKLGTTGGALEESGNRIPQTVGSEHLRIVARHSTGCITDRMNLSKGELLVRLPCANTPSIQLLRNPQEDIGMSIDTRSNQVSILDGITELMQIMRQQQTIRTFTFASADDLHAFQTAITGCTVRYDGLASTLSISRRRMVVPIYKKWEASNVRIQIISRSSVVQVLAFMEDFSHADALCFQVKSTDVFENVKGDGKNKKWAVRMVDAKFSLPRDETAEGREKGEGLSMKDRVRRRFANLEGLEYAEEHDDITVGFETQEDRDLFVQALPAAATISRGITLKRRI